MFKSLKGVLCIALTVCFLNGCSQYTFINGANMAFNKDEQGQDNKVDSLKEANDLYKKGDYQKAALLYEQLINVNSKSVSLLYYAESLRLSNNCSKAISIYDRILDIDAGNIAASEGKGLCYLVMGKFQGSVEVLSQVVRIDASRWKSVNALGIIYALKGRMDESMEYYNLAIEHNGHNPTILNNIGLSLAFSGDYERGKAVLERSLAYVDESNNGKKRSIELNLALLYGLAGDHNMSKVILEKYFSEAEVMNNLGFYASISKDKELARSYLSKALSMSSSHYEKAWNNLKALDLDVSG